MSAHTVTRTLTFLGERRTKALAGFLQASRQTRHVGLAEIFLLAA
jgi:hypothetical protein